MVIERFRPGTRAAIYARLAERGRMLPDGVRFVDSWVEAPGGADRCWQVMDCDDATLLDAWISRWTDLVEFETVPVTSSADAAATAGGVRA